MLDNPLTVLIATRNGEDVLPRTLEAYKRLESPGHAWKMVIVDNGSTDSTPAIIASFKNHLPIEMLQEPVAGKNRALNRGLSAIEGRAVIITDDDAVPAPSFLIEWSRCLEKREGYDLFGGTIEPLFEAPAPKWILENRDLRNMFFAVRDLSEGPVGPGSIFGPNMAVRVSVFERGFRFDENIGANGSDPFYPMGNEAEFCHRLVRNGIKSWFARGPQVQHIVRADQLSEAYLATRAYRHGRGIAWLLREGKFTVPPKIRPPFIRELSRLRHRILMFSPFPVQRVKSVCAYHWKCGFRDEWAKRRR